MIAKKVVEPTDFEWQRQLRYYWDRDFGTCLVNVADTSLRYGFEYQVLQPPAPSPPGPFFRTYAISRAVDAVLLFLGGN